jgi:hypothetical protein
MAAREGDTSWAFEEISRVLPGLQKLFNLLAQRRVAGADPVQISGAFAGGQLAGQAEEDRFTIMVVVHRRADS